MQPLREWILEECKKDTLDPKGPADFEAGFQEGWLWAMAIVLKELKSREELGEEVDGAYWKELFQELLTEKMTPKCRGEFLRALDTSNIKPSNPSRFTDRIKELRRTLSLFDDEIASGEQSVAELNCLEHERQAVSEDLLVAEDDYRESTA